MNYDIKLPNTDWVSQNHVCPPIWYGWQRCPIDQPSQEFKVTYVFTMCVSFDCFEFQRVAQNKMKTLCD